MNKKKILTIVVGLCIALIVALAAFYNMSLGSTGSSKDELVVEIPTGSSGNQVLSILDENGLIKNKVCAKIHMKLNKYSFQANAYILNKGMTLKEVLSAVEGKDYSYIANTKLTVIEGQTIPEYAARVAKVLDFKKEDVLKYWNDKKNIQQWKKDYWFLTDDIEKEGIYYPLEGYLAPETYILSMNDDLKTLTQMMLKQTQKNLEPFKDKILTLKYGNHAFSIHEFMTLSSVVLRESPSNEEDRQLITGLLLARLAKPMRLQCDATVNYGLQQVRIDVSHKDLESQNPYNTYKNDGLPIGPIGGVSAKVFEAVLSYKESEYVYFFTTQDGKVLYARTYEEHLKNVRENKWY